MDQNHLSVTIRTGRKSAFSSTPQAQAFVGGASVRPVAANMGVVRVGTTFPGFHKRLQAHQINRPLGAAMVHEFDRLLPILVFEEDDGIAQVNQVVRDLKAYRRMTTGGLCSPGIPK
jgi:hypothetical protein